VDVDPLDRRRLGDLENGGILLYRISCFLVVMTSVASRFAIRGSGDPRYLICLQSPTFFRKRLPSPAGRRACPVKQPWALAPQGFTGQEMRV